MSVVARFSCAACRDFFPVFEIEDRDLVVFFTELDCFTSLLHDN